MSEEVKYEFEIDNTPEKVAYARNKREEQLRERLIKLDPSVTDILIVRVGTSEDPNPTEKDLEEAKKIFAHLLSPTKCRVIVVPYATEFCKNCDVFNKHFEREKIKEEARNKSFTTY
jgi:hypothetical protein